MSEGHPCKHGHLGFRRKRVQYDERRKQWYACWVCDECARQSNLYRSRRRRNSAKPHFPKISERTLEAA